MYVSLVIHFQISYVSKKETLVEKLLHQLCVLMAHQRDTDDFCDAKLDGSSATFKDGSKGLDVSMSYNFDLYRTY